MGEEDHNIWKGQLNVLDMLSKSRVIERKRERELKQLLITYTRYKDIDPLITIII